MPLYGAGDTPTYRYYLRDAAGIAVDGTVSAVLTDPAGTSTAIPATRVGVGEYELTPSLSALGVWTLTITGTVGSSTDIERVHLAALDPSDSLAPVWAPTLAGVGAHIPTRTRAVGADNGYLFTFTDDTTPPGSSVADIIGHACARVAAVVGVPVAEAAYPACQVAAALWAAYWVEVGYPERDADVSVYDRLRLDAETATQAAQALNDSAGGGTVVPAPDAVPDTPLVSSSFPDPPRWADVVFF